MTNRGRIFVISGPSGVGKGTVVGQVLKNVDNIYLSVSATTRKIREGEKEGVNYFFKTKKEFQEMIDSGQFLEWAEFAGDFYGSPKFNINNYLSCSKDVILEIEIQGAKQIREKCPDSILIFLAPPSFEALEERLIKRQTESVEKVKIRLKKAKEEMNETKLFHYLVVNDDLKEAVDNVLGIIRAERCRITNVK
ncbi:MAG: guanylate kinase [Candidatus Melainabacteria bacterium RIFCSPLOWO2_02_FULL_35_15]|nr:MAG: guanylate kinase [Candidatus Melainabacteria bacterium RIFCSPLOWO2_12_FULL_35_11]OGI13797.1 MAG: guanylate kinase [Candidatus Melainabacteria bacterium RIFCSPLOWO2_02_FULL_35_15]